MKLSILTFSFVFLFLIFFPFFFFFFKEFIGKGDKNKVTFVVSTDHFACNWAPYYKFYGKNKTPETLPNNYGLQIVYLPTYSLPFQDRRYLPTINLQFEIIFSPLLKIVYLRTLLDVLTFPSIYVCHDFQLTLDRISQTFCRVYKHTKNDSPKASFFHWEKYVYWILVSSD